MPNSKPMTLADYLDMFSWGQADLARAADISPHTVSRALTGEKIARRNAQKIAEALTFELQAQGGQGQIRISGIKGLKVADLQRKQKPRKKAGESGGQDPSEEAEES